VKRNNFTLALRRSFPILLGYGPIGMAFGVLMTNAGYGPGWSGLSSLFIYAGSLQFLMVSFLTGGASLITVAVMSLLLNSRHIFYGLSFIESFRRFGRWKWFIVYGLTDENYSLLCSGNIPEGYNEKAVILWTTGLAWFYWVFFSLLGGLLGQVLPFDTTGIDFAMTALFVVILLDQLQNVSARTPAAVALVSALVCLLIFGADSFILPALLLTAAALTALRPRLGRPEDKEVQV
jgi:4-azaleucine resistance transporter AzlC